MKPRKLKELLVFASVNREPNALPPNKKEILTNALMKLNTDELEVVEEFVTSLIEVGKGGRRRELEDESEPEVTLETETKSKGRNSKKEVVEEEQKSA